MKIVQIPKQVHALQPIPAIFSVFELVRSYHLNQISRYRVLRPQAEKEKTHTHVRVLLNQKGIMRID